MQYPVIMMSSLESKEKETCPHTQHIMAGMTDGERRAGGRETGGGDPGRPSANQLLRRRPRAAARPARAVSAVVVGSARVGERRRRRGSRRSVGAQEQGDGALVATRCARLRPRARVACACCVCPCCACLRSRGVCLLRVPLLCVSVLHDFVLGAWCACAAFV